MNELQVLIGELEGYEKSLNFNMVGYMTRFMDGTEHFQCKMCGHCPALLVERLKNIAERNDLVATDLSQDEPLKSATTTPPNKGKVKK